MSLTLPAAWVSPERYVYATITDDPSIVTVHGAAIPPHMCRLGGRGPFEVWTTFGTSAPITNVAVPEPSARLFWIIQTTVVERWITGYILETTLIPADDARALVQVMQQVQDYAKAHTAHRYDE